MLLSFEAVNYQCRSSTLCDLSFRDNPIYLNLVIYSFPFSGFPLCRVSHGAVTWVWARVSTNKEPINTCLHRVMACVTEALASYGMLMSVPEEEFNKGNEERNRCKMRCEIQDCMGGVRDRDIDWPHFVNISYQKSSSPLAAAEARK